MPRVRNNLRTMKTKPCITHTIHLPISLGLFHRTLPCHHPPFPSRLRFSYVCLMVTSLTSIRIEPTLENHHGNLGEVQNELIVNTPLSREAGTYQCHSRTHGMGWRYTTASTPRHAQTLVCHTTECLPDLPVSPPGRKTHGRTSTCWKPIRCRSTSLFTRCRDVS